ncbi:hypothetical protein DSL72_007863 [Monilinia vaccinii-corymbosi]|uniref:Tesmin/TSO1-like CXC domain-containing protein n=1 Tax=Monilinia vaccinii-corymbosi TaxID=61207 RepID=A0A8A3PJ41_9HELO|nr:hypothetical protein DSL72_007863 [Monilinia vaccinii-corymbosi]
MPPSNKRKAEGAPATERFTKVHRTVDQMEQSNSQPYASMGALFRANKLVHDLRESQLRTILVQAYISHPEIAHVVDLEHAKMEHLDKTPSESDMEPDAAPDVASDPESDHTGEDAPEKENATISESDDETFNKNRKVTQLKQHSIFDSVSCSCQDECVSGRCKCSQNSFSCGPACKCTSCGNFLNKLALFFGEEKLRATNCFASWMKAQGPDLDLASAYTQEELRSLIMGVDEKKYYDRPTGYIFYDGSDKEIQKLGKKWLKAKTEAERKPIRRTRTSSKGTTSAMEKQLAASLTGRSKSLARPLPGPNQTPAENDSTKLRSTKQLPEAIRGSVTALNTSNTNASTNNTSTQNRLEAKAPTSLEAGKGDEDISGQEERKE